MRLNRIFKRQIPNGYDYDNGDQAGENQKNEMLELLVKRSAPIARLPLRNFPLSASWSYL